MITTKKIIRKAKNTAHLLGAVAANIRYGFPGRKMHVIGVTGTDGKTSTSHLIYHILKSAGKNVSLSTSIYADIGGEIQDTGLHVTTQNHWLIQKNLNDALLRGSEYFVLETTSHGLDQNRVWGVDYTVAVLTNITPEHLDYHNTYDEYLNTKLKLPLRAKHSIINKDDSSFEKVSSILDLNKKPYDTYSALGKDADITWSKKIKTSLEGLFNRENILAAYGACLELGIDEEEILKGIKSFRLPKGRLDFVYKNSFSVVIDFAHTPNSVRRLLESLRDTTDRRIIHVFGSAGLRDAQKRPDMGRASGENADLVIITEEDYRTEDFDDIAKAISTGLFEYRFSYVDDSVFTNDKKSEKLFTIIKNRQRAIEKAIQIARKGDTIVLTGKGHEESLARGKKEYPWDEYKAVEKALDIRKKS